MKKNTANVTKQHANMTDAERMALVGNLYVERDIATEIFVQLDRMRSRAKISPEPKSLMLIGETGMGKTTLLKTYLERNPTTMVENCIVRPVVYVSLPVKTTIRGAAMELLKAMEVPGAGKGTLVDRTHLIEKQLSGQQVEIVLVDETQHVVEASGEKNLPKVGDFFKDLSKKSKVPFVLAGMPNTTTIFEENEQLKRLCRLSNIGPFTSGSSEEFLSFRRFLVSVDKQLPFEKSARFGDCDPARLIYAATEGKICHVMTLIREAAILAIADGSETVQLDHLRQAFESELDSIVGIKNNPFDQVFMDQVLKNPSNNAA